MNSNLAEVLRLHVLWRSGAPGGRPKAGRDGVIVYHRVEEGRKYFAGLDTAGTEGDFATMVVLREDLEVVALWRYHPHGERLVRCSALRTECVAVGNKVRAKRIVVQLLEQPAVDPGREPGPDLAEPARPE